MADRPFEKRPWTWAVESSGPFRALLVLLLACCVLGGSARGDVPHLIVLRPLGVLLLGYGLATLQWRLVTANGFLFAMALGIVALPALQLVPLPPAIWSLLPARDLVVEIDRLLGLAGAWRPLTLTPFETRNALYATLIPLAAFVLGLQLEHAERMRLLPVILALGGLSALIGLLQIQGAEDGPLYLYPITNNGMAVGLFANRNHQAFLLAMLLPMLGAFAASRGPLVRSAALLAGLVLLLLILVTGSRAGLLLAVVGLLALPLFLNRRDFAFRSSALPGRRRASLFRPTMARAWLAFAILTAGLMTLTIVLGRAIAWERLLATGAAEEGRLMLLPTVLAMIARYFPAGSGMGSFERVYQVHEPDGQLGSAIANHAHNDWLEVILTGGAPALILLGLALAAYLRRAWQVLKPQAFASSCIAARLGLVLVLQMALASIGDYPLRTPLLGVIFVLAVLWAGCASAKSRA